ncbi:MAG TPA: hypothetical protein VIN09_00255 [Chloroflexota bacterium]
MAVVCPACKDYGGCPACAGTGAYEGRSCRICMGRGVCPVCGSPPGSEPARPPEAPCPSCGAPVSAPDQLCEYCRLTSQAAASLGVGAAPSLDGERPGDARLSWSDPDRRLAPIAVVLRVALYVLLRGWARLGGILLGLAACVGLLLAYGFVAEAFGSFGSFGGWRGSRGISLFAVGSLVGAGIILWRTVGAIFGLLERRREELAPPGERLTESSAPRLLALADEVARAAGQRLPLEVYLTVERNLWVVHRRGNGKAPPRYVVGVGQPMLKQLTVSQLRAVLAHEFGHYHRGATPLGPWIYRTHEKLSGVFPPFQAAPTNPYGRIFGALLLPVCRQQEWEADALACRLAGSRAFVVALQRLHGYSGIEIGDPSAAARLHERDLHAPLRQRFVFARRFPPGDQPSDDPPALSLLNEG